MPVILKHPEIAVDNEAGSRESVAASTVAELIAIAGDVVGTIMEAVVFASAAEMALPDLPS